MQFKKLKFKNGLRVILIPRKESLAASVLILVEAGSEYETKKINGLSHFLEHMMFKGTVNRPKPGQVAEEIAALGAQSNAFTSSEYTGYWAKAEYRKLPKILEIVSDLYLNPIFNPEEIEKERGVVIEEINMRRHDNPAGDVQENFTSLLYGDQPAGWDVAGKESIIRTLKREDLQAYRAKHYVPTKTVVVVSGNFSEEFATRAIRGYFGQLKRKPKFPKIKTVEPTQKKPALITKFKETGQSHIALGVRAFNLFDKRRYVIEVLVHVLGNYSSMSSRLFKKVRDEMGAAYHIDAGVDLYLDHGYLVVSAGIDHKKIMPAIKVILEEMARLKVELVGNRELQKSKDHIVGNMILGLETSDQLASFYGSQEILTGKMLQPKQIFDKIQGVSAEEIRSVARAIFKNEKLNFAIVGPYKKEAVFRKILKL
ncbi:MAG: pitrilysin family protein [bacterium]|nr:pitrilysin family protein [bacterium]